MQPPVQMGLPFHSREMADVDTILDRAIIAGDPLIATEHGNQLSKIIQLKGIALAKLLFGLKSNWALFRTAGIGEEFADFIDAHMNITGKVAVKYADMYEAIFVNAPLPDTLKDQLAQKPMKQLLLLTAAVREGSLDQDDLEDVVVLDYSGVRNRVREARGDVTSSGSAVFARLAQRQESKYPPGSLVVFGNGESEVIAHFKLEPDTAAGKKYLERLRNTHQWEDIR